MSYDKFGGGNRNQYKLHDKVWDDLTAPILSARTPGTQAPTLTTFGPGASHMKQYAFTVGDNVWLAFHVPHTFCPGTLAYPHMHWSTDGTDTGVVEWDVDVQMAYGHGQQAFPAETNFQLSANASGTPWNHEITEDDGTNALVLLEPDALIFIHLELGAGTTCTDTVFGLFFDFHYQVDRIGTPDKAPDFWLPNE